MSTPKVSGCIAISHHRNGITGCPFDVAIIAEEGRHMLVVDFGDIGGSPAVAAFDIEKLADLNIRFADNSWRAERYAPLIRRAVEAAEGGVA